MAEREKAGDCLMDKMGKGSQKAPMSSYKISWPQDVMHSPVTIYIKGQYVKCSPGSAWSSIARYNMH